jgi:hypothetical protein
MTERPKPESNNKSDYQPPQVIRVSLRPEEAVLGHCKIPGIAGPVSGGCINIGPCKTFGS